MNSSIKYLSKALILLGIAGLAVGCASQRELKRELKNPVSQPAPIERSSSAAFEECLASLSEPLASANNPATYHLSAKYALACLDEAPDIINSPVSANNSLQTSVMQVHALAISQLLKAGDVAWAEQELHAFKTRYPRRDLLLEEGASFVSTIELIIGAAPREQAAKDSLLNASPALKSELRRQQYWQMN